MIALSPSPAVRPAATVADLIAAQAARTPGAVALTEDTRTLTYARLDAAVNGLAHRLTARGVRPETTVGVLLGRSSLFVVAALAVLRAGGAFLPLDRRLPDARLSWLVRDAGAELVLTDEPDHVTEFAGGVQTERVDGIGPGRLDPPGVPVHPDQAAYVMYTSGSTGRPKGVVATHRTIVDFVRDPWWDSGRQARVLAYSPLDFDSSTYELWVPLARGGQAIIWAPELFDVREMRTVIARHDVTAAYLTTALLETVAQEDPAALAGLDEITTGGDALSPGALRRVREHCPRTTVVHAYGPTETTVFCSLQPFEPALGPEPALDLGRPMAHTAMYVLDEALRPCPPGEVGEIFISGARLARGYLHRPELTARSFVPDPFGSSGGRLYRTGDLARRAADGTITFAGRADRQVKLRGFRIEPGEVETALAGHPDVGRAVVTVREDLPGGRALVAYLVPSADREPDVAAIRAHLAAALPAYLVPSAFVVLPELPLTPHGKVDRAALPRPERTGGDGAAPRTPLETALCELYRDILQCPPVGVDDNFFELGGHSLLAIRLGRSIQAATGRDVTIREVFRFPTVARLAAHLAATADEEVS